MKCGKRMCFHGAFGTKHAAKKKEKSVHGFIRRVRVNGKTRYLVLTKKR